MIKQLARKQDHVAEARSGYTLGQSDHLWIWKKPGKSF